MMGLKRSLCRSVATLTRERCHPVGNHERSISYFLQASGSGQHQHPQLLQHSQRRNFAKVSAISLTSKKRHGHKISMVTAYDYPSAMHVARAGIDIVLVGDSVAMVELGYETTQPMTMDMMLHHCGAVKRGVQQAKATNTPLLVGDMPFGTYEFEDTDIALKNAYRFVQEAGMDAVKLEVSHSTYISVCAR
jgi:3-methyl-2-oxobutanoate hydroxymethyltransferase